MRKSSKRRLTNQEVDKLKDIENLLPELHKKKSKQKHQHVKVEPVKQVDIVNDYIGKIETLMQKYDHDCQKLAERQSYYDKLISEHYHKVETMKFNAVNWIAMLAWVGGVAIANLAPGIPPINALLGSAIIYVVVTKCMPQKVGSMSKINDKGVVISDH